MTQSFPDHAAQPSSPLAVPLPMSAEQADAAMNQVRAITQHSLDALEQAQSGLNHSTITGASLNHMAEVTLNGMGEICGIRINVRPHGTPPQAIASAIMEAAHNSSTTMARHREQLFQQLSAVIETATKL